MFYILFVLPLFTNKTYKTIFFKSFNMVCFKNLYFFRFFTFFLCGVKLYLISKKIIYTTVTTTCKKKQKSKFFTFCLFCPYLQIKHTKRFFFKSFNMVCFQKLVLFSFFHILFMWCEIIFNFQKNHLHNCDNYM